MDGRHAKLPPSGAAAWSRCAQWVGMTERYGSADSEASQEGVIAHKVLSDMLTGVAVDVGGEVTAEMIDGAKMVVKFVRSQLQHEFVRVEQRLQCDYIHKFCWGTPDVYAVWNNEIHVVDYKYGHRYVDEFENLQLIAYAAGALQQLCEIRGELPGGIDRTIAVNLTIVQPRCYSAAGPVRTWRLTASELRPYINMLRNAAESALSPNPSARTGPSCRYCAGRHACEALQRATFDDMEYSSVSTPAELPPAGASLELMLLSRAAERISARMEALETVVVNNLRTGQPAPFHTFKQQQGRLQWSADFATVEALGVMFNCDLTKRDLVTPTQAAKLGIDEAVINMYSQRAASSIKLVPVNSADAAKVFGKN